MSSKETAIFAEGCFWGMQDIVRRLPGVAGTRLGHSDGGGADATYRNSGMHAEALEVVFDAARAIYRVLLEFLLQIHGLRALTWQGSNGGCSYRSCINVAQMSTPATSRARTGSWPGA